MSIKGVSLLLRFLVALSVVCVALAGKSHRSSGHSKTLYAHSRSKGTSLPGKPSSAHAESDSTSKPSRSLRWSTSPSGGDESGTPWVDDEVIPPLKVVQFNMRTQGDSKKGKQEQHMFARGEEIAQRFASQGVDIALVQEHKVKAESRDIQFEVGDYKCMYGCSKRRWGGVGVWIRNDLYKGLKHAEYISPRLMWVAGTFGGHELILISGYGPTLPRQAESGRHALDVEAAIKKAKKLFPSARVIYGTDLNGRVGRAGGRDDYEYKGVLGPYIFSAERNNNGKTLLQLAMDTGLVIANSIIPPPPPGSPQHGEIDQEWGGSFYMAKDLGNFAYTQDHVLVTASLVDEGSVLHCYVSRNMFTETCSDHRPTVLLLKGKKVEGDVAAEESTRSKAVPRRDFAAMADAKLNDAVGAFMDENLSPGMSYEEFVAVAQEAADTLLPAVPKSERKVATWFQQNQAAMVRLLLGKRQAYDRYLECREDEEAHREFKVAANAVRDATREFQTLFWGKVGKEIAEAYEHGPGFFYEAIKKDLGVKTTSVGSGAVGEGASLSKTAQHFEKLLNPQESEDEAAKRREAARGMIGRLKACSGVGAEKLTATITLAELEACLALCKDNKAVGIDTIPAEFLKGKGMRQTRVVVVGILNDLLADGEVPSLLRDAIMAPLYKEKGDRGDMNNYRGLTLLSHVSKLFERVLCGRLTVYFDGIAGANPRSQFGFRAGRGVMDPMLIDRLISANALDKNAPLYKIYVDFVKAYDRVDRELLWAILEKRGVPAVIISLIRSFHQGAMATVRVGGALADPFELTVGLKQGSSLSPLLFNIFLGAIMEEVQTQFAEGDKELGVPMKQGLKSGFMEYANPAAAVPTHYVTEILFADDMAMLAMSNDDLQAMVTLLDSVALAFGQEISVPKTEVVVVVKQHAPEENEVLVPRASIHLVRFSAKEVDGETVMGYYPVPIKEAYSFKYLGSRTNGRGTMEEEVEARERAMCMAWSTLKERVFTNRHLPLTTRYAVYTAMVLSAGLYASAVANHTKAEVDRLESRHFGFLKQMVVGASYRSSREEVIVKAAKEGVCIIPMELLMQQTMLKFAAHVERHNHADEIEPFLPRVVAHSVIAIPGQEKWRTRTGTLRRTVTNPSGYRRSLVKAYIAFGGEAHGPFDERAADKAGWKELTSIQGLRLAMRNWLAKRFAKRTTTRILALAAASPLLMALDEATGEGWEPELVRPPPPVDNAAGVDNDSAVAVGGRGGARSWRFNRTTGCSAVDCKKSHPEGVAKCWSCEKVYCWDCMASTSGGHACAALKHRRAAQGSEPAAPAAVVVVQKAPRRDSSRAQRRADRGAAGVARRAAEEAAALACRVAKLAKAEEARLAAKVVAAAERKGIAMFAKEMKELALIESCRTHFDGSIPRGFHPAPHRRWRVADKGRFLATWSVEGQTLKMWWADEDSYELKPAPFVEEPPVLRSYGDGEDRTATLLATPPSVQPMAAERILQQQGLPGGAGEDHGLCLGDEEWGEAEWWLKGDSDTESEDEDSEDARSSSDGGRVRGSEDDTAGAASVDSVSDGDGGRVAVRRQAQPGDFPGAGLLLLDYTDKETLAAWESILAKKLKRKSLEPRVVPRPPQRVGGSTGGPSGPAAVKVPSGPAVRLLGIREKCDPRLRKRRIGLVGGDDQEVKEGKKPLTQKQRRQAFMNKRREEQMYGGLDLGYRADSER